MVAAGGICAVLNPISNEPKTAAGQLENIKTLFPDTPVITSHKLSAILISQRLPVSTVEDILENNHRVAVNGNLPKVASSAPDEDIAAILFTSGSTGFSKAVKFSHTQLIASVQAKSSYLGTKDMSFMSWVSYDHSACFCEIHLQAMYNGTDQVLVQPSDLVQEPYRESQVIPLQRPD